MSVRTSLLAILTIGPAYGFQLHGELTARTAGRRRVNVGQIYGTLERLVVQAAIESAGTTDDGLPLYRLTPGGRAEAVEWLHGTDSSAGDEWDDLVDRVLIASSLPGARRAGVVRSVIAANRARWIMRRDNAPNGSVVTAQDRLAAVAASALADAALLWLDAAERQLHATPSSDVERGLSEERPRRGRRPSAAIEHSSSQ
ncbi:PadR family transcriptional regulator [Cryobacterium melibiosiphilum]|uniref:PadR family transcriptional regulator n=1 Tax=Cryobacterium melibiosiphilum TaxID=995039 RepID=A0A3A5MEZ0_9MICO|nr:PadR family transcriptional regulator [Cryobacterium melibiosiphilum]RJT87685.1 PadR family transcriptional regulator [Cryobacterium melibiosiphilum]